MGWASEGLVGVGDGERVRRWGEGASYVGGGGGGLGTWFVVSNWAREEAALILENNFSELPFIITSGS